MRFVGQASDGLRGGKVRLVLAVAVVQLRQVSLRFDQESVKTGNLVRLDNSRRVSEPRDNLVQLTVNGQKLALFAQSGTSVVHITR